MSLGRCGKNHHMTREKNKTQDSANTSQDSEFKYYLDKDKIVVEAVIGWHATMSLCFCRETFFREKRSVRRAQE